LGIADSASDVREPQGDGRGERGTPVSLLAVKEIANRRWRIGRHGSQAPAPVREWQKCEAAHAA